jgi:Domain of unknown function (DUF4157)
LRTFAQKQNQTQRQACLARKGSSIAKPKPHRGHTGDGSPASLPARWGHDFGQISIQPRAADPVQTELAINKPGDEYEQEADRISGEVMRMPEPAGRSVPSLGPLPARIGAGSLGQTPAPPISQAVLHSPGLPLDPETRAFMEPRFGHDFSQVRIHSGQADAAVALSLGAAAFTLGSNIFFNSGQYRPASASGLGLLAHELAHVVQQQPGGNSSRLIQRALIPYRQIAWTDFKASPPERAPTAEGAEITTQFDVIPSFSSPRAQVNPTKTACGRGRDRSTEVAVTYTADPADFGKPEAVMDQDKSWALARYTGDGTAYCRAKASGCEHMFEGAPRGTTVRSPGGTTITRAADCFPTCKTEEVAERARLLRHEQGHFDITNVIAKNARESLKASGATLTVTKSGCGEEKARDAARPEYESKVRDVLAQLARSWLDVRNQAQTDYDTETHHGGDGGKQTTWEGAIRAGLRSYHPAGSPAAAPATTPASPAPTSPAPATTPGPTRPPTATHPPRP